MLNELEDTKGSNSICIEKCHVTILFLSWLRLQIVLIPCMSFRKWKDDFIVLLLFYEVDKKEIMNASV